jgi:hypothetical protein
MALDMTRRVRLLAMAGLISLSLAVPAGVNADTGGASLPARYSNHATVDITSSTFASKLLVTVSISVVCDPFETIDPQTGEAVLVVDGQVGAAVGLIQAQGRTVVGTSGYVAQAVTCDGSTVNVATVPIVASSVPFRRGDALAGASLDVCEVPFGSCWASASSGPTQIRLGR